MSPASRLNKFSFSLVFSLVLIGLGGVWLSARPGQKSVADSVQSVRGATTAAEKTAQASGFFELRESLDRVMDKAQPVPLKNDQPVWLALTSHHLPTAALFLAEFYATLKEQAGPRRTFVIVGPDHSEACRSVVSTTQLSYQTPFGLLPIMTEILYELVAAGVAVDNRCFVGEHAIGVQTIFIKHEFPEADIVPILLSSATTNQTLEQLATTIREYQGEVTVIGSVDFSHGLSANQAREQDRISDYLIEQSRFSTLTLEHTDSPPTLRLIGLLLGQEGQARIFGRANTQDFTGEYENTTGYRNIIFVSK